MEPGEENDTGLQFRTQLPDLKLLPVNYDAPPTESDSFMSPRVAGVEAEMLKRTEILIEQDGNGKKKIKGGTIYSIVNYFLTDKDAGAPPPPRFCKFLQMGVVTVSNSNAARNVQLRAIFGSFCDATASGARPSSCGKWSPPSTAQILPTLFCSPKPHECV